MALVKTSNLIDIALDYAVATEQDVFDRLCALPPENPFWKNRWMFSKPVFTNESAQGKDLAKFSKWKNNQSNSLRNHILSVPSNARSLQAG